MADYQSKYTGEEIESRLDAAPYSNLVTSHFSQSETPASVRFDVAALNYTLWKVSDLLPTRDELFSKTKFVVNNNSAEIPDEGSIQFETKDIIAFALSSGYGFAVAYNSGLIPLDELHASVDIPKEGIYCVAPYGSQLSNATVVDIEVGEIKKIDEKFLPDNFGGGSGTTVVTVAGSLSDTSITLDSQSAETLEAAIQSRKPFFLKFSAEADGQVLDVWLNYSTSVLMFAMFYALVGDTVVSVAYNMQTRVATINRIAMPVSSTYSLRQPSLTDSVKAFLEERGLLNKEVTE